jgi:hypothetical protein
MKTQGNVKVNSKPVTSEGLIGQKNPKLQASIWFLVLGIFMIFIKQVIFVKSVNAKITLSNNKDHYEGAPIQNRRAGSGPYHRRFR